MRVLSGLHTGEIPVHAAEAQFCIKIMRCSTKIMFYDITEIQTIGAFDMHKLIMHFLLTMASRVPFQHQRQSLEGCLG